MKFAKNEVWCWNKQEEGCNLGSQEHNVIFSDTNLHLSKHCQRKKFGVNTFYLDLQKQCEYWIFISTAIPVENVTAELLEIMCNLGTVSQRCFFFVFIELSMNFISECLMCSCEMQQSCCSSFTLLTICRY
jgi:hypothetical protein